MGIVATPYDKARNRAMTRAQKKIAEQNRIIDGLFHHSEKDCDEGRHVIDILSDVEVMRSGRPARIIRGCVICGHVTEVSD